MVLFVVAIVLLAAALGMLTGAYRIVAEAFHDSAYLGIAVMLVPPVFVVFVLARWSMCWPGTKHLLTGGAAFGLTWFFAVPLVRGGDVKKVETAVTMLEAAHDAPYQCPKEPKRAAGFATYCCTRKGWALIAHGGCSGVYQPVSACSKDRLGELQQTVCGTVGKPLPEDWEP